MKIYLDTIGCRLNQAEIEQYARQFRALGHVLVSQPEEADLAVVNTCAVTAAAASDSRQKARQISRAGAGQVVVTGCWATLQPREAAALPGVSHVVNNLDKDNLVPNLLNLPPEIFELEPLEREPIPGARSRTRAFIKVQDGCDNHCTFCITRIVRGPARSRKAAMVLADVRAALLGEAQEIVLTGVHLGSWGQDLSASLSLRDLILKLLSETDIPRLRLSSLEPWDLGADFFSLWENQQMCRHLHLPLQSGSAATLRRMARKTSPGSFSELLHIARQAIPGVAVTTDIIVGFPGETEAEFEESLEFVRRMGFAGGHVFTYSPRPGTAGTRLGDQVPTQIRKERSARMRSVLSEASKAYQAAFVGLKLPVLWESAEISSSDKWELNGLTDNYLRVTAQATRPIWNRITSVQLISATGQGLTGRICS
jgi:threonylcarbamoyladenosine tRNA methylthiotransferase MtaB